MFEAASVSSVLSEGSCVPVSAVPSAASVPCGTSVAAVSVSPSVSSSDVLSATCTVVSPADSASMM